MLSHQIKTAGDLKRFVENRGTETHFFTRATMKFHGDSMKNYGVRRVIVTANYDSEGTYHKEGVQRDVWELYRRRPVKHGVQGSAYFDAVTFERVFAKG